MNKFTVTLASSLCIGALAFAVPAFAAESPVVATVNGAKITQQMLLSYARTRGAEARLSDPQTRQALTNELISRELLYADALAKKLDKGEAFKQEMENAQRDVLSALDIAEQSKGMTIKEADMRKTFDEGIAKMANKEYKARHILVKTEDEAKAIITDLGKGSDFSKIAQAKSQDAGSGANGGDLGWFAPTAMVKPFADAVAALPKGTYTKKAVQSQFGWHVILLDDTREVKQPVYDSVKDNIRGFLQQQAMQNYLGTLRQKAKIEIK